MSGDDDDWLGDLVSGVADALPDLPLGVAIAAVAILFGIWLVLH